MKAPRQIWKVLTSVLVGSALASRLGAAPALPEEDLAHKSSEWDAVRQEFERAALVAQLPADVRQFVTDDAADLSARITRSFALTEPGLWPALHAYWGTEPMLPSDSAAREALDAAPRWSALAPRPAALPRDAVRLAISETDPPPDYT
ncbi:MAG: hypothetical protein AAF913_04810 [Pseudomonadota bacterium]